MEKIVSELESAGFDYALAIATDAEVQAGAACGQLSIIIEEQTLLVGRRRNEKWLRAQERDLSLTLVVLLREVRFFPVLFTFTFIKKENYSGNGYFYDGSGFCWYPYFCYNC